MDVESWRTGARLDADAMAAELDGLLARTSFGRPIDRLDITVTTRRVVTGGAGDAGHANNVDGAAGVDGAEEHLWTQHFTYRVAADGFTEDLLFRNLHPMLAERLDLWRLSDFTLRRLPSAEDVYLIPRGRPHEPKRRAADRARRGARPHPRP